MLRLCFLFSFSTLHRLHDKNYFSDVLRFHDHILKFHELKFGTFQDPGNSVKCNMFRLQWRFQDTVTTP